MLKIDPQNRVFELTFEVFTAKIASIMLNLPFPTHQGALGRINYSLDPLNSRKTPQNRSLFRHMRPRKRGRFEIYSPTLFQQISTSSLKNSSEKYFLEGFTVSDFLFWGRSYSGQCCHRLFLENLSAILKIIFRGIEGY